MMADYDMSIHTNPDAVAWAKFFCETNPGVLDEGIMVGWFANAMMAMHDHLSRQPPVVYLGKFGPMDEWDQRDETVLLLVDYTDGDHPLDDALVGTPAMGFDQGDEERFELGHALQVKQDAIRAAGEARAQDGGA